MTQPYIGEIRLFPWNFAPRNWAFCNGQIMPIAQNQALFALIGTMYGGNGVQNFALPNLQSRTPVDRGSTYSQGTMAGSEQVALTVGTMPMHSHAMYGTSTSADRRAPAGTVFAADTSPTADFYSPANNLVPIGPASIGQMGGNQPHNNLQPYLVLNYCIAISGIFPSRN